MRTPSGLALIAQEPRLSPCRLGAFVSSCTSFYSQLVFNQTLYSLRLTSAPDALRCSCIRIQAQEAKTLEFQSKSWLLSDEPEL